MEMLPGRKPVWQEDQYGQNFDCSFFHKKNMQFVDKILFLLFCFLCTKMSGFILKDHGTQDTVITFLLDEGLK